MLLIRFVTVTILYELSWEERAKILNLYNLVSI